MCNKRSLFVLTTIPFPLTLMAATVLVACSVTAQPMFPAGSPPSSCLDVVELQDAGLDLKLAATTLQGLVNRGPESKIYLQLAEWDAFWLERLKEKGLIAEARTLSPVSLFEKYRDTYDRVIVYDPALPATINIATMMASLKDAVAAWPDHEAWISAGKQIEDLRGRWKTNVAAYEWAFETLWPKMNQRILACYHPTATQHHMRDYFVRNRVFHCWVTGEEQQAGERSNHAAERAFLERLLAAAPVNTPVLGFWYSGLDRGMDEYRGAGVAGEYGKLTIPCDWTTNLSVLSGAIVDTGPMVAAYRRRLAEGRRDYPSDRVYICHSIVESGDAPSYLQSRQYRIWQDPARGGIPINWAMGPGIFELAPLVAAHYFETATPNDYLFMALSGAAYCHPYRNFMKRTANLETGWQDYLALTAAYMRRMGCNEMVLYTDAWRPYVRAQQDPVTQRFTASIQDLQTIVLGMGRDDGMGALNGNYWLGSPPVLVSHVLTRWPVDYAERTREENIAWQVEAIREQTPSERPAFLMVMALSWAFDPKDIVEVHRRLGAEYEALTIPQFNEAFRQYHPPSSEGATDAETL